MNIRVGYSRLSYLLIFSNINQAGLVGVDPGFNLLRGLVDDVCHFDAFHGKFSKWPLSAIMQDHLSRQREEFGIPIIIYVP